MALRVDVHGVPGSLHRARIVLSPALSRTLRLAHRRFIFSVPVPRMTQNPLQGTFSDPAVSLSFHRPLMVASMKSSSESNRPLLGIGIVSLIATRPCDASHVFRFAPSAHGLCTAYAGAIASCSIRASLW